MEKQRTLASVIEFTGTGLHTGKNVSVRILPAEPNSWYSFKRVDLPDSAPIPAIADFVVDISRGTTLAKDGVSVATVEHFLSALAGLGIDNALIEVDGAEMPILDGSSALIVKEILKAGIVEQQTERKYFEVRSTFTLEDNGAILSATPTVTASAPQPQTECERKQSKITVMIDFNSNVLPPQYAIASAQDAEYYAKETAPSRTFVFLHEIEPLYKNNLIRGGDLSNAIVFVEKPLPDAELDTIAGLFGKEKVSVSQGMLNNVDLRFKNEPARHKLLDVIGDLALVGAFIKGDITAIKPGHKHNTNFARLLRKAMKEQQKPETLPLFDINAEPIYDINAIKRILPHRSPFLLIDKIVYIDKNQIVGVKNITMDEPFFQGHFPSEPVMPGVLQIEAMAQTGGVYMLTQYPDPENYLTYFLKINNVRFRDKVVPGDTLIFKLIPLSPLRRGLCEMKGWGYIGNKVVVEAELLAQLSRKPDAPAI
ncbi:MAG: bifunctional UDP-3-O-[3-hydroxymyristoyl] N-acetylglucosamine deacetylase/3-hydroxyacyl-ACP dehydratase [Bacteroidales bacterium]|jgi:UDP-3-O-[3-hydroxymyristoyl] N-acetylglucosamine deacetylase/3-hydroxyacyl-[acyl-carrier-protein] dehydratase|nr:bifunctional UDP-3-O-[3-hydroxymyristoyl] N-acetylglucosamine deacetylase/3-hydroxyacyl-ACP dehydratase [Bacteroidales bacterium]